MTEVQDSWRDVMSKTEALGQKLRGHLEREEAEAADAEAQAAGAATDGPAAQGTGGDSEPDASGPDASGSEPGGDGASKAASTRAAVEDLGNRLQGAFESFGQAAKDPEVRHDVKDIGVALKDALMSTLTKVSDEVGDKVKKVSGSDDTEPGTASTDAPSTTAGPTPAADSNGTDDKAPGGSTGPEASGGPERGEPAP